MDIISSFGFLKPLILSMQLCQMIIQALWVNDSRLLQLMDSQTAALLEQQFNIKTIDEFLNMEDESRTAALKGKDMQRIANACNRYPFINMECEVTSAEEEEVELGISLSKD